MARILVLSSFPAPYRVDIFTELRKKYELDIFFESARDQDRNEEFFVKKNEFKYNILTESEGKKKLNQCISNLKQYDLVLAYDWYLRYALKVELKCMIAKVPYIINCDGALITQRRRMDMKFKDIIKTIFVKHASMCFSSGKYATKYFEYYGAKRENIVEHTFSSLHCRDILEKPLSRDDRDQIKKEIGLLGKKCVVSVGQFIYRKGFDIVLSAWDTFDKDYQLVIIGGGPLEKEYREYIKEAQYNNVNIISFVPKNIVMKYLAAADLFVLPTREDIWGLVVNEALAVGTPVITTDQCVAGLELLVEGMNGYIFESENTEQLERKMKSILDMSDNEAEIIATNAISSIKTYTIENVAKSHIKHINSIILGER